MKHALWGFILLYTSLNGFVKIREGLTIKSAFHFHKPSFINFGYIRALVAPTDKIPNKFLFLGCSEVGLTTTVS